jgi:hypothetical protein
VHVVGLYTGGLIFGGLIVGGLRYTSSVLKTLKIHDIDTNNNND